jgi:hypothetical protein
LLLAGLSLTVSPELLAEESPEEQAQAVEETGNDAGLKIYNARSGGLDVAATSLAAAGGLFGTASVMFLHCGLGGPGICDDKISTLIILGGGVGGGYLGYKNGRVAIVVGGVLTGGLIGGIASSHSDIGLPVFVLSATSLGYLGYRIWRARESDGDRYSLLPYWDEERSGVILSGRF